MPLVKSLPHKRHKIGLANNRDTNKLTMTKCNGVSQHMGVSHFSHLCSAGFKALATTKICYCPLF